MSETIRKTKALRLTEQDCTIIAQLQEHYGMTSVNEVIRLSLRAALREVRSTSTPQQELTAHPAP